MDIWRIWYIVVLLFSWRLMGDGGFLLGFYGFIYGHISYIQMNGPQVAA